MRTRRGVADGEGFTALGVDPLTAPCGGVVVFASELGATVEAGQVVALNLPERLPFEPLGMVLPVRDVSAATQTVADFLTRYCQNTRQ